MRAQTRLATAVRKATDGSATAIDEVFTACYDELRRLAHRRLALERRDHTLQTTELVHEAYIRLVDGSRFTWRDRAHFFAVCARVMRHVLVDYARRRARRFANDRRVSLDTAFGLESALAFSPAASIPDFLALDQALSRLQKEMPEKARAVEMRFFAGMTYEEIAEVLGTSPRTARRHTKYAQARLYEMMKEN